MTFRTTFRTTSRTIAEFELRIAEWARGCAAAGLLLAFVGTAFAQSYAEREARLEAVSPQQRAELLRKKQRFDALAPEEQARLRQLHESLMAAPDSDQLQVLLTRYSNWLKSLQAGPRAEILDLPEDERLARIKEIVRDQESQRFKDFVNYNLPAEDQEKIYQWLDRFVAEHEQEILDNLRDDRDRRHVRNIDDDRARRRTLITRLAFRRPDSKMPFPSKEEINDMVTGLSEATRKELESAQDAETRQDRAFALVFGAIWSISFPHASEEELRKYYAGLPAERRSKLENLDADELQRSLRQMYRADKFWRGGPPRGGDGPRGPRQGGSSRPDLERPPPGFASPKTKK